MSLKTQSLLLMFSAIIMLLTPIIVLIAFGNKITWLPDPESFSGKASALLYSFVVLLLGLTGYLKGISSKIVVKL